MTEKLHERATPSRSSTPVAPVSSRATPVLHGHLEGNPSRAKAALVASANESKVPMTEPLTVSCRALRREGVAFDSMRSRPPRPDSCDRGQAAPSGRRS
jgi:hypothetical protein